ncbi:MAG: DNA-processing protein DprA, partial [Caulobacteraceae bacterium]
MKTRVLSAQERVDWLRLARTETVGPVAFAHLLHRYGSAAAALAALPALARRGGRASPPASPSREEAEAELTAGEAFGARLLASCESEFPPRLAALDPPPPILWAAGDGVLLARPSLAVVGARAASAAGQRFARSLAAELGEAGFVIVSGLARGIDAAAHAGAL